MTTIATLRQQEFALVLSGGAALGYAHVGVLDCLERKGLQPAELAGTSMGAIVAAACAIGLDIAQLDRLFAEFSRITKWASPALDKPALIDTTRKLEKILTGIFGDRTLADAEIPLKIVATDFDTGRKRVFSAADEVAMKDVVLCSSAIPVLFPPVELQGHCYLDGFLSDNLPVAEVDPLRPVLAVDVMSERAFPPFNHDPTSLLGRPKALMSIYQRSLLIMVNNQVRQVLATRPNLLYLAPELGGFNLHDFNDYAAIKQAGYRAAQGLFADPGVEGDGQD